MKCPMCHGKGGFRDAVLYDGLGGGPYEDCTYCNSEGTVSLARFLYWHVVVIFWEETVATWWYRWMSQVGRRQPCPTPR